MRAAEMNIPILFVVGLALVAIRLIFGVPSWWWVGVPFGLYVLSRISLLRVERRTGVTLVKPFWKGPTE